MATTIHEPPRIDSLRKVSEPSDGNDGGLVGGGAKRGNVSGVIERPSEPVRTGILVGLATIAMSFAALTSALIVRQGSGNDWHPILLPRILFLNTFVLVLSSLTLEIARRKIGSFARSEGTTRWQAMQWLGVTLGLGLLFVAGQYWAWLQLRAEGMYLATNPNSSFFYVLTAAHAIHVLGGLGGLSLAMRRLSYSVPTLRKSTMDATSYYWHFMGMLWIYLLCVLWLKL